MTTFDDVLSAELKELFSAQRQWLLALPGLIRGASSPALAEHLRKEARETKRHVERIELVMTSLGGSPRGRANAPMRELVHAASGIQRVEHDAAISDARLIIVAQRVAHFLICGYGTSRTLARVLGLDAAVTMLEASLDEKYADDRALTALAVDLYTSAGPAQPAASVMDEPFQP